MNIQAHPHRTTHQRVQQSVQHVQPSPQKAGPDYSGLVTAFGVWLIITALCWIHARQQPAGERSYNWVLAALGSLAVITGAFMSATANAAGIGLATAIPDAELVLLGLGMMFLSFVRYCWRRMARSAGKHFTAGAAGQARS